MSGELCTLHNYALALRQINMLQVAGDLDYLVAWLKSPEWTGGPHLKPDPAGKNTVDAYSNNCPIPYTACRKLVDCCTSLYVASGIVNSAKSLIQSLLTIYKSEVEQIAIKVYLDYVDDLIYLIDGVEPGPTPPPPEPEGTNSYINTDKTDDELLPNVDYILYDSSASLFSYDYKQAPEIVGVYNSEDGPLSNDISIKCMHDGTSWKLYISTASEGVIINRIKINTKRVTRDHIVLGGMMTSSSDNLWKVIDLFTTMSIDS